MGTLNEILSLISRMDKGYRNAVSLNENSIAFQLLDEGHNRERVARQRSLYELQKIFADEQPTEDELVEKLRKFEDKFYHDSSIQGSNVMRLEPLICRIAFYECGFGEDFYDGEMLNRLKDIVDYLYNNRKNIDLSKIVDENSLYTWTFEDLENVFGKMIDENADTESQEINNTEYTPNDYEIIGPLTYEQAHEIGNLSCPNSKLCYTRGKETWDSYTNNGINTAYVALRKGGDDETLFPAVHDQNFVSPYDETQTPTDNSPYDTYGLSMIFVFVSPRKILTTCNTRWNHQGDYEGEASTDHALNRKQISEIIGMNFFQAFKPVAYDINDMFNDALENGNGYQINELGNIGDFEIVKFNDKYNLVDNDCNLKFKKWFDDLFSYSTSIGNFFVCINRKWNMLNANGDLIWNKPCGMWFDNISPKMWATNKSFLVWKNDKKNFLLLNGKLLLKNWFDATSFGDKSGLLNDTSIPIAYNKQMYMLSYTGEMVPLMGDMLMNTFHLTKDEDEGGHLRSEGWELILLNQKYNYVSENGKILSDIWFNFARPFNKGYAIVTVSRNNFDTRSNWIKSDGTYVWNYPIDQWFDDIIKIDNGLFRVYIGNKMNYMQDDYTLGWPKPPEKWFNFMNCKGYHTYSACNDNDNVKYFIQNGKIKEVIDGNT